MVWYSENHPSYIVQGGPLPVVSGLLKSLEILGATEGKRSSPSPLLSSQRNTLQQAGLQRTGMKFGHDLNHLEVVRKIPPKLVQI